MAENLKCFVLMVCIYLVTIHTADIAEAWAGNRKCDVEWIRYSYCHGSACSITGISKPAGSKFLQKFCNKQYCVITAEVTETCVFDWTAKTIQLKFSGIEMVQIFNSKTSKVIEKIGLDNITHRNVVELNMPVRDFYIKFDVQNTEEYDLSVNVSVCCGPVEGCPQGFSGVRGDEKTYCFRVSYKNGNWKSAQRQCSAIRPGAHPIVITDSDKWKAVVTYFKYFQDKDFKSCNLHSWGYPVFYTSGQRQDPNDCSTPFVWKPFSDQTFPLTFAPWQTLQPDCDKNGSVNETCVHIVFSRDISILGTNDISCHRNGCPFCETSTI